MTSAIPDQAAFFRKLEKERQKYDRSLIPCQLLLRQARIQYRALYEVSNTEHVRYISSTARLQSTDTAALEFHVSTTQTNSAGGECMFAQCCLPIAIVFVAYAVIVLSIEAIAHEILRISASPGLWWMHHSICAAALIYPSSFLFFSPSALVNQFGREGNASPCMSFLCDETPSYLY